MMGGRINIPAVTKTSIPAGARSAVARWLAEHAATPPIDPATNSPFAGEPIRKLPVYIPAGAHAQQPRAWDKTGGRLYDLPFMDDPESNIGPVIYLSIIDDDGNAWFAHRLDGNEDGAYIALHGLYVLGRRDRSGVTWHASSCELRSRPAASLPPDIIRYDRTAMAAAAESTREYIEQWTHGMH